MLYPQNFTYLASGTSLNPSSLRVNHEQPTPNIQPITDVLPYRLFLLVCGSLCISTVALVFSALIISVSHLLIIVPPVFALTILYHAVIAFIASGDPANSRRLFCRASVTAACVLSVLWIATAGMTVAVNVLIGMGKLNSSKGSWSAIIPCACSFIEAIILGFTDFLTLRERKQMLYTDKWKWQGVQGGPSRSTQWRYVFSVIGLFWKDV
jgi:hypothetical protein